MGYASTISVTVILETETCFTCGVAFAMPDDFKRRRIEKHDLFYCPAGHGQHYTGETDAQKFKRLYEQEQRAAQAARDERDRKDRQLIAAKGQVTRAVNRAKAGICPVKECHRHFVNLERHMGTKHPDYKTPEVG